MKFVNHQYDVVYDFQMQLFTNILRNIDFEKLVKSHKNVTKSFFKIKAFKSLKEVSDVVFFSMLKTLRIIRKKRVFFRY